MKYFRIFLALVLVTTGCGTTYKNFPPAEITKRDRPQIEKPVVTKISDGEVYDPIDQNYFDQKISEIKGKISYYHPKDSAFIGLYNRTEGLALQQDSMRVEKNKGANTWGFVGGLVFPLVVGVALSPTFSQKGDPVGGGLIAYLWLITSPLQFVVGAFLGYNMSSGLDISDNQKKELTGIVDDYNTLIKQKAVSDTIAQPQPQINNK